jgi:hypothetical protein
MNLSDAAIRRAKTPSKPTKLSDGLGLERGPFFWTDKLMLLYQLIRSPHETYPPSHIHG